MKEGRIHGPTLASLASSVLLVTCSVRQEAASCRALFNSVPLAFPGQRLRASAHLFVRPGRYLTSMSYCESCATHLISVAPRFAVFRWASGLWSVHTIVCLPWMYGPNFSAMAHFKPSSSNLKLDKSGYPRSAPRRPLLA